MLSFAAIRRQLHGLAVRPVKGLINVQHRLNRVVAGRHVLQARPRIALRVVADRKRLTGLPRVHCYTENHLRLKAVVDLHARLFARIVREQKQQPAVQGLGGARDWKADCDRLSGGQSGGDQE